VFVALMLAAVTYAAVVFASGTMIRTGHPLASEVGRVVQQVTMIQPAIEWTESQQWMPLASALRLIADGAPIALVQF